MLSSGQPMTEYLLYSLLFSFRSKDKGNGSKKTMQGMGK